MTALAQSRRLWNQTTATWDEPDDLWLETASAWTQPSLQAWAWDASASSGDAAAAPSTGGADPFAGSVISSPSDPGLQNIRALIYGTKWSGAVTYDFPDVFSDYGSYSHTIGGFFQVSLQTRTAVRLILQGRDGVAGKSTAGTLFGYGSYSAVSGLSLQDGNSFNAADISVAGTDTFDGFNLGTARVADFPRTDQRSDGGDVWFGNDYASYMTPVPGSYAWHTTIHELGHALGLKHGHDASYGQFSTAMTSDRDSMEFSVMTYRSYAGGPTTGYTNETYGFAQTLMMYDIAALQFLYGANFTTNSTNTTYKWDPSTGEMFVNGVGQGAPGANRVFLTVWDGGGVDTYDMSNYATSVTIDLTPGGWSTTSAVQKANLGGGVYARGNVFNALQYNNDARSLIENAIGGSGADTITGNAANNSLNGGAGADYLYGMAGNDVLDGGGADGAYDQLFGGDGADTLRVYAGGGYDDAWGGAGDDTVVYDGTLASTNATFLGGVSQKVTFSNGIWIYQVEHIQFSDGVVHLTDNDYLFDELYYSLKNQDVFHAAIDPRAHYMASGWQEGRNPNEFFSTQGYLDANPDVKAAGANPLEHFRAAWAEQRDTSANFDVGIYLVRNPDVAAAGVNPLEHFLKLGRYEGRSYAAMVGNPNAQGFDAKYYLMTNHDIAVAGIDPYTHYMAFGWREGRNPNAYFNTAEYLARYTDVAAANINPFTHYMTSGWHENRDPSKVFDTSQYLAAYTDVAASGINPLLHYLRSGAMEGRLNFNDGVLDANFAKMELGV